MIAHGKVEVAVELDPKDRERLDLVAELERRIAMLEARTAAATPATTEQPVYLSPKKFAKRWDLGERTVRGWLGLDDGLPHVTAGAKLVRIPVADGDAWVRARRETP